MNDETTSNPTESRSRPRRTTSAESVVTAFLACPRCSYFLSGYRLIHDDFDEAVTQSGGRWLDLTWNWATSKLIQKSYGSKVDLDLTHLQGICSDCRRAFVYDKPGSADTVTFRVQIKPR